MRSKRRVRPLLLLLLWVWSLCIFFTLDLFINVPEFDGIRPRAPWYEGMRIAAHKMVGEQREAAPLCPALDPLHAVTFGRNQLDEEGWGRVRRIVERSGERDPRIRAAVHETLTTATLPRPPYRGGVEALRLAAAVGDESTWDLFLHVVAERHTVHRKLPLTAARDDLALLDVTCDAVIENGTPRQRADLAQRIAAAVAQEDDEAAKQRLEYYGQRLLGDVELYRGARQRLEAVLPGEAAVPAPIEAGTPAHGRATGELLVKFKKESPPAILRAARAVRATHLHSFPALRIRHWRTALPVREALRILRADATVEYADENGGAEPAGVSNDSLFSDQWALHNTGQNGGTNDADIDAPEAWDIQTGSSGVVVAMFDNGIEYTHEDLADNIWTNPGEDLNGNGVVDASDFNGMDDDLNGYVDDLRGWDFWDDDNDPFPIGDHGTAIAGLLGATGNNGIGIAGVNWTVRMMPIRRQLSLQELTDAQFIAGLEYATELGVRVSNHPWVTNRPVQAVRDAIENSNQLCVFAAGNSATGLKGLPAGYDVDNIVSAAATDENDAMASFTNWGDWVDLAAPGDVVRTTKLNDTYGYFQGTSPAASHVAGAAALILAEYPTLTLAQVKRRILFGTDYIGGQGKPTLTNGRLNLHRSLENDTVAPAAVSDLAVLSTAWNRATLVWSPAGDDGTVGVARAYDVRYSSTPITAANFDAAARAGLPAGTTGSLVVTGLSPGTYHFALKAVDNVGNESTLSNGVQATMPPATVAFADDMEAGTGGWTATGLWHLSARRTNSGAASWYYGQESTGDYDTGAANSGTLTSPAIDLTNATEALLTYHDWSQVQTGIENADRMRVQASTDGATFTTVFETRGTDDPWTKRVVDLTPFVGGNVYVRFWFDTVDDQHQFEGWYVDDVTVDASGPPLALASDDFESGGFGGGSGWNGAWFTSGDVSVRSNGGPHSGIYHVRFRKGNGYLSRSVDLSGKSGVRLRFWSRVNSFEGSDRADVFASPDGSNWTLLRTFTSADTTYDEYDFDLSGFPMTSAFFVAFDAGMSANNDQWYIDDVRFVVASPPPSDPPVADAGPDQSGDEGSTLTFDGSGSADPDGTIVSYAWDFGDGTNASGVSVNHAYADDGVYTVTLTVTDDTGRTDNDTAIVTVGNVAPTAGAGGPYPGDEGSSIVFTASVSDPGSADTHTFAWDFGDGSPTANGQSVSHAYADNGSYTVTVTVTDDDGGSDVDSATATVFNVAPAANAGGPYSGAAGTPINFSGSATDPGSADTHTYVWDFGDGSPTASGQNVSHAYASDGTYDVTLTVTDDDGASDGDTTTATVGSSVPITLAVDDFESAGFSGGSGAWVGAWTTSGDVTMRTGGADGPHSGSAHVRLRRGDGYLERTVDLAGATDVKLRFWAKLASFESSDQALVRVSPDGVNWTTVHTFVNGDDDNTYRFFEIDLSAFAMTAGFRVAFDAEMNKSNDRWFLDDIELFGVPGS